MCKRNDLFRLLWSPPFSLSGTPRQDVPRQIYEDAAMFDDVFDRQGRLFMGRNTPKVTNPLNSLQYNRLVNNICICNRSMRIMQQLDNCFLLLLLSICSLHDPHCKRLFLNNQSLREHLIQLGLLTDDLRVISTTKEQRQKIKAHELLERKEQLIQVKL